MRIWDLETGKEERIYVQYAGALSSVLTWADEDGLFLCSPGGASWRAREVEGRLLPADPLLHEAARFEYRGYVLPIYRFPERFEWAGPEDEPTRCIRLLWPDTKNFDWRRYF
ncbi:hypothetical protein [Oceanithermus sp.]